MILDINISWGNWPFQHFSFSSPDEMKNHFLKNGIRGGLVRSAEAAFSPDLEYCNRKLFMDFDGSDNFIALPSLNPHYQQWKTLLTSERKGQYFAVYPGYHGYSVMSEEFTAMAKALDAVNAVLIIVMRQEDERGQNRYCQIPAVPVTEVNDLAKLLPGLKIICLNCSLGELRKLLPDAPNISADIAFAETLNTVRSIVDDLRYEQILFGSHTPFLYTESALMKLKDSYVDEKVQKAIAMENAERILEWNLR